VDSVKGAESEQRSASALKSPTAIVATDITVNSSNGKESGTLYDDVRAFVQTIVDSQAVRRW
jgi:hypothetical protein